tara:strand:- start:477 stop:638 length:162 start_codon:yes stop_codon:yes gene_type:complete
MINYKIVKAIAIKRYDLVVNGITIVSRDSKKQVQHEAQLLIRKGLLEKQNVRV